MKLRTIAKILIFSFLMLVVIGQITPTIAWNSLVGFFAYFFFTFYCLKGIEKEQSAVAILVIIISTRLVVDFYGIYLYFAESISSLPYLLIHLAAIISAFAYLHLKKLKSIPFLLASFFTIFMFLQGWQYWIHRAQHGTFTGRVSYSLPAKFEAFDEERNVLTEDNLKGKLVLLDFWHTRCGYCFLKFPKVESVYQAYRNDPSVMVLAVNKPIEEDAPNQAFEAIRREGYSFPVVITKDPEMSTKFGVFRFPVVMVVNEVGTVIYKGDIEGAVLLVDDLKSRSR